MQDPLFSVFKIKIIVAGVTVFEDFSYTPDYIFTFDKNKSCPGGPFRAFTIIVTPYDRYNNPGVPGELSVRNSAPTIPTCTLTPTVAGTNFNFSFPLDTDFRGYRIWISTTPSVPIDDAHRVYDGPDSSVTVPLAPGTTYYYVYAAYDAFGYDLLNYSSEGSFTTLSVADSTPPAVPTGLSLSTTQVIDTDGSSFAKLRAIWTANTESDIAGYTLAIQITGTGIWSYISVNGGANIAMEWNVRTSTSFDVKIAAFDRDANASAFSSVQTLTSAADTTPPNVPTWGTCTSAFRTFTLLWSLSSPPADLHHFELWQNTVNNSATATKIRDTLNLSAELQFALTGLLSSTTYYYWLKAIDNSGNASAFSAVQSLILAALGAPTITNPLTSSLITDVDGTQNVTLDVAWTNGAPAESISYTAEISLDNFVTISDTKTVTGLSARFYVVANLLYYARVRTNDGLAGYSAYSSILSLTSTKDTTPPAIPTGVTISSAIRTIFLNWVNPTATPDYFCTNIYRNTTNSFPGGTPYARVSGTAFVDSAVAQGTTYYYFLKSQDTSGNETVSPTASVNTTPGTVATSDITNFAVDLTKQYNATIALAGFTWTDNSPGAGSIAWSAGTIYYQGVAYAIVSGNTSNGYVYFAPGVSTTVLQTSATNPVLTDAQFMVATNVSGAHDLAWNAIANALIGTAYIQNLAVTNAKINDLVVDKLTSGSIAAQVITMTAGGTRSVLKSSNWNGTVNGSNVVTAAGTAGFFINSDGYAEFNNGVFRGSIVAGTIAIGSNAFQVDSSGNLWMGAATFGAAPFSVSAAGALIASSATISGIVDIGTGINRTLINSTTLTRGVVAQNRSEIYANGSNYTAFRCFNWSGSVSNQVVTLGTEATYGYGILRLGDINGTEKFYADGNTGRIVVGESVYAYISTAGLPAYTFTGRTTDGMYSSAVGTVSFASGGVESLSLTLGSMEFAKGRAAAGDCFIDFHSESSAGTYTDFNLRVMRGSGANGNTQIQHHGSGLMDIEALDTGSVRLLRSGTSYLEITGASELMAKKQLIAEDGQFASSVMATATASLGGLMCRSQGSGATAGAAMMCFHRPGVYASYFGIDSDNVWKFGGWSAGAAAYPIWHQGNAPINAAVAGSNLLMRDASGDGFVRYINTTDDTTSATISYVMAKFGDNYHRSADATKLRTFLGQTVSTSAPSGGNDGDTWFKY